MRQTRREPSDTFHRVHEAVEREGAAGENLEPGSGSVDETVAPEIRYEGAGLFGGALLLLGLAILVVLAVAQNGSDVEFAFLWLDITIPLGVLLLVTALVAVVVDELVGLLWRRRRRSQRQLRAEVDRLRHDQ